MDRAEIATALEDALVGGPRLSPEAQEIIVISIHAIKTDQHVDWDLPTSSQIGSSSRVQPVSSIRPTSPTSSLRKPTPGSPVDAMQSNAVGAIALKLTAFQHRQNKLKPVTPAKVTTYDLLHNISRWVDAICPFEKATIP